MTDAVAPYRVKLEAYYGPMDLLLHLVQVNEVDVLHIPISRIADQYVEYIGALQKHDLDLSGDFIAMASTLMLLKSRTLVPAESPEEIEQAEEPPLLDLIRKLLEFRRVKDMASRVDAMMQERALRYERPRPKSEAAVEPLDAKDLELWDLVVAFARLVDRTTLRASLQILYRDIPIEKFFEKILAAIAAGSSVTLTQVVGDWKDRGAVVGSFLAMLELAKQQKVRIDQPEPGGEITILPPDPTS